MKSPGLFSGTLTAVATPFTADSSQVDFESFGHLLDFQQSSGVQGIVVCGSTGEAASLSDEEYKQVIRFAVDRAAGQYQVVAGMGTNNMVRAIELARFLSTLKLDGVLCVTPPYSKPSQSGLAEFFRCVKRELKHPLIAYNVPGRTGVNLLPATVAELAADGTIVALKESSGSIEQLSETVRLLERPIDLLSGEDALIAPAMVLGATGAISASANIIPRGIVEITSAALAGNFPVSAAAQIRALPAVKAAFLESNPIPVKFGLYYLGVIAHPVLRLPLQTATAQTQAVLKEVLVS